MCRLEDMRSHSPFTSIDAADTSREGDRATAGDNFLDRLILGEAVASLHPPLYIDTATGKPDRDSIRLPLRGRFKPVRHGQDLLRRTLQQRGEPTGSLDRVVRLDNSASRFCISHWMPTCRSFTCH